MKTISFSEKNKGWTSFWNFNPGMMAKLNNRFFGFKNGQLYLFNDETNPIRNNFFGEQQTSEITTIINDSPEKDKIFKTLVLEGTKTWSADLKTNYTKSTLSKEEYKQRESRWFAYLRKNEDETDLHGHSAQGIGNIVFITGNIISFDAVPKTVNIGDSLFQVNGTNYLIGIITNIDFINNTLEVQSIINSPLIGSYCFSKKPSRIEGGEMRGYYLEVHLENNNTDDVELFAIESNVKNFFL